MNKTITDTIALMNSCLRILLMGYNNAHDKHEKEKHLVEELHKLEETCRNFRDKLYNNY